MSTNTTIALGRDTKVFAVKEAAVGVFEIPVNASLIVVTGGEIDVPNPAYEEDKSLRANRSTYGRFQGNTPPTPWKLSHYLRPSGTAGTAPEASDVLECVKGKKTVVGATSVAYDAQANKPSFSLYVKKGHTVFAAAGCAGNKINMKKDNKGILEANEDGQAMKSIWTGTGALGEEIVTTPAPGSEEWFLVDDNKRFCTGSHVLIDTEQMQVTGTFWEGTAGGSAGKIKLKRGYNSSAVASHLNAAPITPWLPAGTELGAPLSSRVGTLTIDAVELPFTDLEFTDEDPSKMLEEEVTQSTTPTDFIEGEIKSSFNITIFFRKAQLLWFADAVKQVRKVAVINYGSIAGKKIAVTLQSCEFDVPKVAGDKELVKLTIPGRAYAVAGYDESQIKFL